MSNLIAAKQMPAAAQGTGQLLRIDGDLFRERFDRGPFLIEHNLCDHPLFTIDRMLKLAKDLPQNKVEYCAGDVPIAIDSAATPRNGLSADETIRRVEECNSWMLFRNAEIDPEYRDLLASCLADVAPYSEPIRPGMGQFEAFLILSSPNAVAPLHIDPEHNFLLQIRGDKNVTVFDRKLVSEEQLERFYCGAHRNLPFEESFMAHSETLHLPPGKGVHIPVTAPHFVKNGPSVSVSLSITFRTPDLERTVDAHVLNARLRRAGIRPFPVGRSKARDTLKSLTNRGLYKSLKALGRG